MDLQFSIWVEQNLHTKVMDSIMIFFTSLGEWGFIWVLLTALLLLRKQTRKAGIICAISLVLALLLGNVLLKNIFMRARPYTNIEGFKLLIPKPDEFSFPSGHAASSFATATAIFIWDRKKGAISLVLALVIALSRVYLTVHYITDVLAGALLGIACAFLANMIVENWQKRKR